MMMSWLFAVWVVESAIKLSRVLKELANYFVFQM